MTDSPNPSPGAVAQIILAELKRQRDESGVYLYGDEIGGPIIGIEGWVDIEALAEAILRAPEDRA
jgi:hypothetical protein